MSLLKIFVEEWKTLVRFVLVIAFTVLLCVMFGTVGNAEFAQTAAEFEFEMAKAVLSGGCAVICIGCYVLLGF